MHVAGVFDFIYPDDNIHRQSIGRSAVANTINRVDAEPNLRSSAADMPSSPTSSSSSDCKFTKQQVEDNVNRCLGEDANVIFMLAQMEKVLLQHAFGLFSFQIS